jgi:glycosyltransferase involved in cell wall biosynthesis
MEDEALYSVLHITPHMGGGFGRVLLAYLTRIKTNDSVQHGVICLDYANKTAEDTARVVGFSLVDNLARNPGRIITAIKKADIVVIHWWNHPLLYDFLIRQTLPPARIIIWSHVSGFHPPYVFTEPLLKYPDIFVFTTPLSLDAPETKNAEDSVRHRFRTIWSTSGVDHVGSVQPRPHKGFRVGYIGTVDYCKLHPDFLKMCMEVNVPGVHFVVCGGPCEDAIREEAGSLGISERFTFAGQVDNIADYLCEFDVFGYPLAPTHYGTCDQALSESMAAGVPPVVLSNGMERYMVENGATGFVAQDGNGYARAIEELYRRPALRSFLSSGGRIAARRKFSITTMIAEWEQVYEEILELPKRERKWTGRFNGDSVSPAEIFIESLGECGREFSLSLNSDHTADRTVLNESIRSLAKLSYNWRSDTRGTAHHYHSFFPEDEYLRLWSDLTYGE